MWKLLTQNFEFSKHLLGLERATDSLIINIFVLTLGVTMSTIKNSLVGHPLRLH